MTTRRYARSNKKSLSCVVVSAQHLPSSLLVFGNSCLAVGESCSAPPIALTFVKRLSRPYPHRLKIASAVLLRRLPALHNVAFKPTPLRGVVQVLHIFTSTTPQIGAA